MTTRLLKFPAPYFGGKTRVAAVVWQRLGDVSNFIEPFCGSAAVLLARPDPPKIETINDWNAGATNWWRATDPLRGDPEAVCEWINDADPYLANVFRALQAEPEAVADWANAPVSELDLHAIHRWLVLGEGASEFRERLRADPWYYDPQRAGAWLWGICCWIGSGWCATVESEAMPILTGHSGTDGRDIHDSRKFAGQAKRMPCIGGGEGQYGQGIHAKGEMSEKLPKIGPTWEQRSCVPECSRLGADGHRPQLADAYARGRGVHGNDDVGTCEARRRWLCDWFGRLRDRLRTVRVCSGHWLRVCGSDSVTVRLGTTGIFFDPPYAHNLDRLHAWIRHLDGAGPEPEDGQGGAKSRDDNLYANDRSQDVDRLVAEVHRYCRERGSNPLYRIALAGYAGEHEPLEAHGWECVAWAAAGGYGNRSAVGKANAKRERLWFSPHCVKEQRDLFSIADAATPDPEAP